MTEEEKARKKKGKVSLLKEELKKREEEVRDYYDKYLRALAELDNYRKRVEKEREESSKYANQQIIYGLLPVLDSFERAIASGKGSKEFESLYQGVELIHRQLKAVLEKEGLKSFSSKGEAFDPSKHEAIAAVEWEDCAPDTVVEEIQPGYYLKEKLIRPAQVMVSKARREVDDNG